MLRNVLLNIQSDPFADEVQTLVDMFYSDRENELSSLPRY